MLLINNENQIGEVLMKSLIIITALLASMSIFAESTVVGGDWNLSGNCYRLVKIQLTFLEKRIPYKLISVSSF